eukprot:TRINITY_DN17993_c0_g1_i1.p1 TRINITY_DN17993_c0_g1~~TRINITY_DN17993_c0_g1_i1.p1  ORF type:complete len:331 (-),score=21.79 TRINITY_DN17993_c0_g1_i1:28-915(-)
MYATAITTIWGPWGWWKTRSGLIQVILSHFMLIFVLVHFLKTNQTDPGRVTRGWKPNYATQEEMNRAIEQEELNSQKRCRSRRVIMGVNTVRYCVKCKDFKPPRTHHCSDCNRCTLKMDHHCPWVNNCIGLHNQKYFINFLAGATIMLTYASIMFALRLISLINNWNILQDNANDASDSNLSTDYDSIELGIVSQVILLSFDLLIMVPVTIGLFTLLFYQIHLISKNVTTVEEFERKELMFRAHKKNQRFNWYYDQGCLLNYYQVMGNKLIYWLLPIRSHDGDGISWITNDKQEV